MKWKKIQRKRKPANDRQKHKKATREEPLRASFDMEGLVIKMTEQQKNIEAWHQVQRLQCPQNLRHHHLQHQLRSLHQYPELIPSRAQTQATIPI